MKSKKAWGILSLTSSLVFFNGCATMFGPADDVLHFESEPEGASIYINNKMVGKTPCNVTLPRAMDSQDLSIRKDGYKDYNEPLPRAVAGPAWFNFGFITTTFGGTSWGVDAATGHLLSYDKKSYAIKLVPAGTAATIPSDPMEYVIVNYDVLRQELASAQGERFHSLCGIYALDANQCREAYREMREKEAHLPTNRNALTWYRDFSGIAAHTAQIARR